MILLSTIMPDELLNEETFKTTLQLIKEGGFDGVVGWDMPVYIDFPKAVNLVNLVSATLFTIEYVKRAHHLCYPQAGALDISELSNGDKEYLDEILQERRKYPTGYTRRLACLSEDLKKETRRSILSCGKL